MMEFGWVAIALEDVIWITLAFILGFLSRLVNLPPLVGFLITGFILNYLGIASGETLEKLADIGITLLLFTIGLKLNLRVLIRPQVWAVSLFHMSTVILILAGVIFSLTLLGLPLFSDLDFKLSILIAFALSFSSTVFVVKILEDKGEMNSLHGRIAIGILVMQDLVAVLFLAISTGKSPSIWALSLLLLIPLRPLFFYLLKKTGPGELLILYGFVFALGGAQMFELVGIKGDLGALIMGVYLSTHAQANSLSKSMLGFKDLFLVGFFLSIGMSGILSLEVVLIGVLLVPFIFMKSALFYILMTRFKLRARTSLLSTLSMTNYSEFGLIVAALSVANGWIDAQWLIIIAVALSVSFIIAAPLNNNNDKLYQYFREFWMKFQSPQRLSDDTLYNVKDSTIAIFGMGRIGLGAYTTMYELHGNTVVGIDFNDELVQQHQKKGFNVLHGDSSDSDFWDKVEKTHSIKLVMLALPNLQSNLAVIKHLKEMSFTGSIATTSKYRDDKEILLKAGATTVFDTYTEAGAGFANHVEQSISS